MRLRNWTGLATLLAIPLLALTALTPAGAGGFGMTVERCTAGADGKTPDAALIIRAFGCMGEGNSVVKATLEGLVNGERKTQAVKLTTMKPDTYSLARKDLPRAAKQGDVWMVAITGTGVGITRSILVALDADGKVRVVKAAATGRPEQLEFRSANGPFKAEEIKTALEAAAGQAKTASAARR